MVLVFFQSFKTILFSSKWENSMWSLSILNSLIRPRNLLFWHWCYSPDFVPLFTCRALLCQEERFEVAFFFLTSYVLFFWMQNMYLEQGNTAVLSNIVVTQYLPWALYGSLWNAILYNVHNGHFSQSNNCSHCCESKSLRTKSELCVNVNEWYNTLIEAYCKSRIFSFF